MTRRATTGTATSLCPDAPTTGRRRSLSSGRRRVGDGRARQSRVVLAARRVQPAVRIGVGPAEDHDDGLEGARIAWSEGTLGDALPEVQDVVADGLPCGRRGS